jgi:hypothetical protein
MPKIRFFFKPFVDFARRPAILIDPNPELKPEVFMGQY